MPSISKDVVFSLRVNNHTFIFSNGKIDITLENSAVVIERWGRGMCASSNINQTFSQVLITGFFFFFLAII